jgi:hypothetical protein
VNARRGSACCASLGGTDTAIMAAIAKIAKKTDVRKREGIFMACE